MKNFFTLLFIFTCLFSFGQKERYRFAATYFGVESEVSIQKNSFISIDESGNLISEKLPSSVHPRFVIGGTHFWNRADFYISFNLASIRLNGSKNAEISNDVLTGFRIFPFQLTQNRAKPFAGIGFNSKQFRLKGAKGRSQLYTNRQWYFEAGFCYATKAAKLISLEARYFSQNNYSAYYNRQGFSQVDVSLFSFSISYKKMFDFSNTYSSEKSQQLFKKVKDQLKKNKQLNTYSFGIGVSAFIPFEKTEYVSRIAFLNDEIEPKIFPELGFEYFFHNYNFSGRIAYRPIVQKEEAFNYTYQLNNHSISLECFKFIGNYHGFVPFAGPSFLYNFYHLKESDDDKDLTNFSANKAAYALVFGWDIRFTETDYLVLRTNMRYTPDLGLKKNGLSYTPRGLEFNFIQLVYYPERKKALNKIKPQ